MPRGGGARGSIQAFKTLSHFPGEGMGSIQAEEWSERRDYMERKRVITLFDFQCQRSIFHVALCWEGNIQILCTFHWTFCCMLDIHK